MFSLSDNLVMQLCGSYNDTECGPHSSAAIVPHEGSALVLPVGYYAMNMYAIRVANATNVSDVNNNPSILMSII